MLIGPLSIGFTLINSSKKVLSQKNKPNQLGINISIELVKHMRRLLNKILISGTGEVQLTIELLTILNLEDSVTLVFQMKS